MQAVVRRRPRSGQIRGVGVPIELELHGDVIGVRDDASVIARVLLGREVGQGRGTRCLGGLPASLLSAGLGLGQLKVGIRGAAQWMASRGVLGLACESPARAASRSLAMTEVMMLTSSSSCESKA